MHTPAEGKLRVKYFFDQAGRFWEVQILNGCSDWLAVGYFETRSGARFATKMIKRTLNKIEKQ